MDLKQGQDICYVRGKEMMCRRARLLSDGITEVVKGSRGEPLQHAWFEYHDLPRTSGDFPPHTFETQRHWDPLGAEDTWHLPTECPFAQDHSRCPFATGSPQPQLP